MLRFQKALAVALAGLLTAGIAMAFFVEVEFIGGADLAAFETYAWTEGTPLANFEVERAIRETADEKLAKKGYRKVATDGDFLLAIQGARDDMFPGGTLRVEVYDGDSRDLIWRGRVEGVLTTKNPNKLPRLARQATKQMFKKFPARQSGI
jgi:hypothetical protein